MQERPGGPCTSLGVGAPHLGTQIFGRRHVAWLWWRPPHVAQAPSHLTSDTTPSPTLVLDLPSEIDLLRISKLFTISSEYVLPLIANHDTAELEEISERRETQTSHLELSGSLPKHLPLTDRAVDR